MASFAQRSRAMAAHTVLTAAAAAACLGALLLVWYPLGYAGMLEAWPVIGGTCGALFVLGPLLTLAIYAPGKGATRLRRDFAVLAVLQLGTLAAGIALLADRRPVHVVFEFDRLRVVRADDVPEDLEHRTPAGVTPRPLGGPTMLGVRPFRNADEQLEATLAALHGLQLSYRPDLWQEYRLSVPGVLRAARPVSELRERLPAHAAVLREALRKGRYEESSLTYLPVMTDPAGPVWTALLDARTAQVLAVVPIDSF